MAATSLDRYIRVVTIIAATTWALAAAIEFAAGRHGWAAAYAGIAGLALAMEAVWGALRRRDAAERRVIWW